MSLEDRLAEDLKTAMRAGDKSRVATLRLIRAALKQQTVDTGNELDEATTLAVLEKMLKQRRDSVQQYDDAGRNELADAERTEIAVIEDYMPAPLDDAELDAAVDAAIAETGAASMQDMGTVMGLLKQRIAGRADMGALSGKVKARLG